MVVFTAAVADNAALDAAIGGGLVGAAGVAIGSELGGRDGAIVDGAIGGGVGTSTAGEAGISASRLRITGIPAAARLSFPPAGMGQERPLPRIRDGCFPPRAGTRNPAGAGSYGSAERSLTVH